MLSRGKEAPQSPQVIVSGDLLAPGSCSGDLLGVTQVVSGEACSDLLGLQLKKE